MPEAAYELGSPAGAIRYGSGARGPAVLSNPILNRGTTSVVRSDLSRLQCKVTARLPTRLGYRHRPPGKIADQTVRTLGAGRPCQPPSFRLAGKSWPVG
jgi:hypothetical protein